jgi:hypothetical protein
MPQYADAIRAAEARMSVLKFNVRDLAVAAELDAGTVGDFLAGNRWPRRSTRAKLEEALGFQPNVLQDIAEGRTQAELLGWVKPDPVVEPDVGPEAEDRTGYPVGLGLDDEAADLTPEQIESVRAVIRAMKPQ